MQPSPVLSARRALLGLVAITVPAALILWATDGVSFDIGALHVSARNPRRPSILAGLCALGWLILRFLPGGRSSAAGEWRWWRGQFQRLWKPLRLSGPRQWHPAVVIAMLGAVADVSQWLRGAPLWLDEQMIAINLRDRSFAELSGTLWLGQSGPLGWLWLQRAILLALGPGELVLRLVPLIFGLGTLAAAAWIGWRWLSRLTASIFVVLCWIGAVVSHYRFELKHYSADVFWALLLPALAVWACEAGTSTQRLRRHIAWFSVAGIGLWFANGALFVAPGCVLWMLATHLRARDLAGAARFAAAGVIWLALFTVHYQLSLRYTHHNAYLRQHWANRVPPADANLARTVTWIAAHMQPVARDTAGTRLPILFWIVGAGGLLIATNRRLSLAFATVLPSALVLAALRLVPFYERFSLWIVPAFYLGLTLAIGRGVNALARGYRRNDVLPALAGGATAAAAIVVTIDVIDHGRRNLDIGVPADSNHAFDDRSGVAWVMHHRQPGDAIVTTRLGWPAIWWYGGLSLAEHPDGRLADGSVLYELSYHQGRQHCSGLVNALRQHRRLLLYVSFPDISPPVYLVIERGILALGDLAARRHFTPETRAAVVRVDGTLAVDGTEQAMLLDGCVDLQPARRW